MALTVMNIADGSFVQDRASQPRGVLGITNMTLEIRVRYNIKYCTIGSPSVAIVIQHVASLLSFLGHDKIVPNDFDILDDGHMSSNPYCAIYGIEPVVTCLIKNYVVFHSL